jgi:hypothetical protein
MARCEVREGILYGSHGAAPPSHRVSCAWLAAPIAAISVTGPATGAT